MTTMVERSELAVTGLNEAQNNVMQAIQELRYIRDNVMNHPSEKSGLHSIDAEIGALELASRAIAQQYYSWAGYNDNRKARQL